MKLNSIVAVHPAIDPQFEDADVLSTMSKAAQEVITDAKVGGANWFKTLTVGVDQFIVYNVYGSAAELEETIAKFGAENVIPMGSWNWDGTRYGTNRVTTFDPVTEETVTTIEGTPSIALHPQLLEIMPDDYTFDADGNVTGTTPATSLKQVILRVGQGERILT